MRSLPKLLAAFASCLLTITAFAQADTQLTRLLKQHPEADTNKDGTLSMEEARTYLRTQRRNRQKEQGSPDESANANESRKPSPTYSDVAYGPHERNVFDFWAAKSTQPTPLVVFIHGGGFVNGSKNGANPAIIKACLDAGVSFMAINYRFRESAAIQDILRDCARSIQFVRAHARQYNIEPARIASYGGSAGAGTSLWLAFHPDLADPNNPDPVLRESSRIVAAGALNTQASYDLTKWEGFLGKVNPEWVPRKETTSFYHFKSDEEMNSAAGRAILADVDMLGLISSDDPPVFLYNSMPDGPPTERGHYIHHPNHARAVARRCAEVGVSATLFLLQAEPKGQGDYLVALEHFLINHVKGPLPSAPKATTKSDLTYGTAGGMDLKLDLSVPVGSGPFPTAILVHGGGWAKGDKARQVAPLFEPLSHAGFAWVSINYRLAPEHQYPGSVEDVETAIRWVKSHAAEYRFDPRRIALIGESAGGHLVALVATRGSAGCEVAAVVPVYAPTNLVVETSQKIPASIAAYFGVTEVNPASLALLREASPLYHVRRGLPPFLLLHGTVDKLVDHEQSIVFQKALREAGVTCDLISVRDGGHGMNSWDKNKLVYKDALIAWLNQHLNP
ncbi:MAG: alpha/beta hydrolase [Opitutaceae bacterium]|nr:alpha/beta hydrolase [Opitutaceae bacterium]